MADTVVRIERRASNELAAFAERAQQLNHDLRTPIGTFATALELLRAGGMPFGDEDMETLEVLQRQVAKLTALAESLRDFACDLEAASSKPSNSGAPARRF